MKTSSAYCFQSALIAAIDSIAITIAFVNATLTTLSLTVPLDRVAFDSSLKYLTSKKGNSGHRAIEKNAILPLGLFLIGFAALILLLDMLKSMVLAEQVEILVLT